MKAAKISKIRKRIAWFIMAFLIVFTLAPLELLYTFKVWYEEKLNVLDKKLKGE